MWGLFAPNGVMHEGAGTYCKSTWPDARVVIEGWLAHSLVDVLVHHADGHRTAFEVALSEHHQLNNIRKDLRCGCMGVVVVCLDKKLKNRLMRQSAGRLSQEELSRVEFKLVSDFPE